VEKLKSPNATTEPKNRLNLRDKATWQDPENLAAIAERFGCSPDQPFAEALAAFVRECVEVATEEKEQFWIPLFEKRLGDKGLV